MTVAASKHAPALAAIPQKAQAQPLSAWAKKTTCEKIWTVVKAILIVAAAVALCIYNPTIFVVSFVAGIILSKQVAAGVEKINSVLKSHPYLAAAVIGGFCLIGLHAALLVGSALLGGHLGSWVYHNSKKSP